MMTRVACVVTATAVGTMLAGTAGAQDPAAVLHSAFLGPEFVMSVITGGSDAGMVSMQPYGNADTQLWVMNEQPSGWMVITSLAREGEECLDVVNGGPYNNMVWMQPCGNFSGQNWSFIEYEDGTAQLFTQFRGNGMCLDVVNGGQYSDYLQLVPCGDYSGQYWTAELHE